jgi:copper chaperone CopZ
MGIVTHFGEKKEKGNPVPEAAGSDAQRNNQKKTLREAIHYGFKVIPGEIANWLIIGVIIGGAISALVPADFGTRYLGSPFLNYLVILLISIPIYVCATGSIPIAASLITKGVLPGAALVLLIAGPATNTVTISFVYKRMGKKITVLYIVAIILVSVFFGLVFDMMVLKNGINLEFITAGGRFLPYWFKILAGVVLVIIFLNTKFDLGRFRMKEKSHLQRIIVPDMTCQHCKMKITEALQTIPEVKKVDINLNKKEVAVNNEASRKVIIAKIRKEGYHPEK